jgi:D-alanyl-D-alanine carboxypeptidase
VRILPSSSASEDFAALLAARVGNRGAALLAVRTPGGAWSGAVGLPADLPPGPPRFLAYSITKSFLAVLVLQLREEGRYELDDSLARFAPDVPEAERISLRQLLNHTAGLPDYGALPAYHAAIRERPAAPWSFEEFAAHTFARGLDRAPGERFAYSNPGYALLRRLVERETGQTLRTAIALRIAGPLALRDTEVVEDLADLAGLVPAVSDFGLPAAGCLDVRRHYHPGWVWHGVVASTPEDVARFYEQLFAGALVSTETLREMTALVPVEAPWRTDDPGYGLGLMGQRSRPVYGHNGGGPGYGASAFAALDAPGGAAVACAMCAFEGERVAEDLAFSALEIARSA